MAEERLAEWLEALEPRILRLKDDLPRRFVLDYSPESLRRLETIVLVRLAGLDDVRAPRNEGFTFGVAAYLGETFRRMAGGSWGWNDEPASPTHDLPVLQPDPALGLKPLSPVHLIMSAVLRNDRRQFTEVYEMWRRAVETPPADPAARRSAAELRRSADPHRSTYPSHLTAWLVEREHSFPGWAAAYVPGGVLDFSPDSLDAVEKLVREMAPAWEELTARINRGLFDGACWYVGEVVRRALGGRWSHDGTTRFVRLVDVGAGGDEITPELSLKRCLDEPGHLRRMYDTVASGE